MSACFDLLCDFIKAFVVDMHYKQKHLHFPCKRMHTWIGLHILTCLYKQEGRDRY